MTTELSPGPKSATFTIGDRCDADCVMCRHQGARVSGSKVRWPELRQDRWPNTIARWPDLSFGDVEKVVHQYGSTLQACTISSFGEPTLHPDFERIFRIAADNGRFVGMITNGSRLGHYTELIATSPGWLTVSIDSPDPVRFRSIRRNLDLGTITAAIDAIQAHPKRHPDRSIGVNMTITTANADEVGAMADFCRKHRIRMLTILCAEAVELSQAPGTGFHVGDPRIRRQVEIARNSRIRGLDIMDCFSTGWWTHGWPVPCRLPNDCIEVNPDGTYVPCCRSVDCALGKIGDDVWNGEPIRMLRQQLAEGKVDPERFYGCSRCPGSKAAP